MLEDFRLKVFLTVSETGSFTKAAKLLGISQPAVSQNISALEKETGATLFCRARGEASLTSHGQVFKTYAEHILYWYNSTNSMFGQDGKVSSTKHVRISADSVVASYILPDALSLICGADDNMVFHIQLNNGATAQSDYTEDVPGSHFANPENADVEITAAPSPETIDFEGESRLIGVMEAVVISSPDNRTVNTAAVSENDNEFTIKPFSTIGGIPVSNNFAVWSGYERFFTPDLEARTNIVSDSVEAIKSMVENSMSLIGIVPSVSVRKELSAGSLIQMPVRLPNFTYDIHFNPLPEFSGKSICARLKEVLLQSLK